LTRKYDFWYAPTMAGRKLPTLTVTIEENQGTALRTLRLTEGISASFAVREGLRMWLDAKGYSEKAGRKRAATRKRP
jgi:hypothetical protein